MNLRAFAIVPLAFTALLGAGVAPACWAQAPSSASGRLVALRFTGSKRFSDAQLAAAAGLRIGETVGRDEIQAAADRLTELGYFASARFRYTSKDEDVTLEFELQDAPTAAVFFDNFPWFTDAELTDAIKQAVGLFDGTAPEQGSILDAMAEALQKLLASRGIHATVERTLMAPPTGSGMIQQFRVVGASLNIGAIEFGDSLARESRRVQERLSDLLGRPYSRFAIEVFLDEHVRPAYLERGLLRVEFGRPSARFTGDPNRPLPDKVLVVIPIKSGPEYRWNGVEWRGDEVLGTETLNRLGGLQPGDIADGVKIAGAWLRVQDEYGRRGYLEARVAPEAIFDEAARRVSYRVTLAPGMQYRMGELVITGLSLAAERRLRDAWRISPGQIFDRVYFDEFLASGIRELFLNTPVHYEQVGNWLRTNSQTRTVDVLLDFH